MANKKSVGCIAEADKASKVSISRAALEQLYNDNIDLRDAFIKMEKYMKRIASTLHRVGTNQDILYNFTSDIATRVDKTMQYLNKEIDLDELNAVHDGLDPDEDEDDEDDEQ
jgi:predicted DNA-binding protein (UPF0278 family)